jgi:GT2 family glycosyltransferase
MRATSVGAIAQAPLSRRLSVVLLTHNCVSRVGRTLDRLDGLGVPVVVVDNASTDGTAALVRSHPSLHLVSLRENLGAAGRNVGAEQVRTPYIAFCDDDEWFELDGLHHAADLLDRHPSLALVNGRILVEPDQRLDPICAEMAESPLPDRAGIPGAVLLGFMAGAVVVRRSAYEQVGGYDRRVFMGGEEETLALPLAKRGWQMRYVEEVVIHHQPSRANARGLRHFGVRNTIVNAWLHRPVRSAARWTWFIVRTTPSRWQMLRGVAMALRCVPWVLRERSPMPADLDRWLRVLEDRRRTATPTRRRADSVPW